MEKPIIEDALSLAEDIARIIFENSYFCDSDRDGVLDLLLFGSTLSGPAHDIDMLVIHNSVYLNKLGVITSYDCQSHSNIPDPDAKGLEKYFDAKGILLSMGSPEFPDYIGACIQIMDVLREKTGYDKGYSGNFCLPYVGEVKIKAENPEQLMDAMRGLEQQLRETTVLGKVRGLLFRKNLDLDKTLDMQAMNVSLLTPDESYAEQRSLAIQQCSDPTFWHTLLTTGKLYNQGTGKFTDPIQEKYPLAVELFAPKK